MRRKLAVLLCLALLPVLLAVLNSCAARKTQSTDVDIDFTVMNAAMRYAEVTNILQSPDEYVGKTARFVGYFAPFPDGEKNGVFTTGRVACEIPDQTNCCAQIIEFVLADPGSAEFPETGRRIIVQGRIDVFQMPYGMERCQLIDAVMDVQRGGI